MQFFLLKALNFLPICSQGMRAQASGAYPFAGELLRSRSSPMQVSTTIE
jgi:hypothetical protein